MAGYGTASYGTTTYGAGTLGAFPPISIAAPAALATTSMTPPVVALGIVVAAPAALATASMTPPRVRLTPHFAAYDLDANSSQALNIPIGLSGVLEPQPKAIAPPADLADYVDLLRVSPVMPTPTLDSNGRPT